MNLAAGQAFGGHIIVGELGRGGMGVVYLARELGGTRTVALKVLRRELTSDRAALGRFAVEMAALARLQHPHIVQLVRPVWTDEPCMLVMEHLKGETLADRLRRAGALSVRDVLVIADQLASALQAAHAEGIVHRDLKPANVFLLAPRPGAIHAKLIDFGVAKLLSERRRLTRTGDLIGTPYYMAPEQCVGRDGKVDARSDIYALGIMMFEMLTGRVPFNDPVPTTIMAAHLSAPLPDLRLSRPDIPEQLHEDILRATSKRPEERFATMTAFRDSLRRYAWGEAAPSAA